MPVRRLSLFQRSKALTLLAKGRSINKVAEILRDRYHPDKTVAEVRREYFPRKGYMVISKLEDKSREEILVAWEKMKASKKAYGERASKRMTLLFKDPVFAAAQARRGRVAMKKLRQDSKRAKKREENRSNGIARYWKSYHSRPFDQDSEYRKKHLEGIARYWNDHRLRVSEEAGRRGIIAGFERKKEGGFIIIPATVKTPLTELLSKERKVIIDNALGALNKQEQEVVDLVFGFSEVEEVSIKEAARILGVEPQDAEALLESTLIKLFERFERLAF